MKVSFDRFKGPTAANDKQPCAGCHEKFLPEHLDGDGLCYFWCSPFEDEEDEKAHEGKQ